MSWGCFKKILDTCERSKSTGNGEEDVEVEGGVFGGVVYVEWR